MVEETQVEVHEKVISVEESSPAADAAEHSENEAVSDNENAHVAEAIEASEAEMTKADENEDVPDDKSEYEECSIVEKQPETYFFDSMSEYSALADTPGSAESKDKDLDGKAEDDKGGEGGEKEEEESVVMVEMEHGLSSDEADAQSEHAPEAMETFETSTDSSSETEGTPAAEPRQEPSDASPAPEARVEEDAVEASEAKEEAPVQASKASDAADAAEAPAAKEGAEAKEEVADEPALEHDKPSEIFCADASVTTEVTEADACGHTLLDCEAKREEQETIPEFPAKECSDDSAASSGTEQHEAEGDEDDHVPATESVTRPGLGSAVIMELAGASERSDEPETLSGNSCDGATNETKVEEPSAEASVTSESPDVTVKAESQAEEMAAEPTEEVIAESSVKTESLAEATEAGVTAEQDSAGPVEALAADVPVKSKSLVEAVTAESKADEPAAEPVEDPSADVSAKSEEPFDAVVDAVRMEGATAELSEKPVAEASETPSAVIEAEKPAADPVEEPATESKVKSEPPVEAVVAETEEPAAEPVQEAAAEASVKPESPADAGENKSRAHLAADVVNVDSEFNAQGGEAVCEPTSSDEVVECGSVTEEASLQLTVKSDSPAEKQEATSMSTASEQETEPDSSPEEQLADVPPATYNKTAEPDMCKSGAEESVLEETVTKTESEPVPVSTLSVAVYSNATDADIEVVQDVSVELKSVVEVAQASKSCDGPVEIENPVLEESVVPEKEKKPTKDKAPFEIQEVSVAAEKTPTECKPTAISSKLLSKVSDAKALARILFPLEEGLRCKQKPDDIKPWIALALTLDGRDKITKVFEYVARFLAWFLSGTGQGKRFAALKASLTKSRKAFRLGRSMMEYHRFQSSGMYEALSWHLLRSLGRGEKTPEPPSVIRKASSNIAWSPSAFKDIVDAVSDPKRLYHSMSSLAMEHMYRPIASKLVDYASDKPTESKTPLVVLVGTSLKMLGLFGYWTADNLAYLLSSGLFDNYKKAPMERAAARKSWSEGASRLANRSYFMGSVAGLVINMRSYIEGCRKMKAIKDNVEKAHGEELTANAKALEEAKEKQFSLAMALMKSCCDVIVFSNNPGVDYWAKRRGRPLNEGIHCFCAMLSASTVLYDNFPNADKK